MRRYLLIALIIFLAGIIFLTNFFIKKERSVNEILRLKQQNENLKAQIQELQALKMNAPTSINHSLSVITAKIFSTYPFNIKNKITINAGEKQGVKELMTATVGENILLGQVVEVFESFSVIKTIFDPAWQSPVGIGEKEIDGLFQGGNELRVTLISREMPVKTGDIVYSSSREFSYGLKIGEVIEVRETAAGVFKEAILRAPFNVNELREVNIIK